MSETTKQGAWKEFTALLKIAGQFKKKNTVDTYCDLDLNNICIAGNVETTKFGCIISKIYIEFDRMWKCGTYKWDTGTRTWFYQNSGKFFDAFTRFYEFVIKFNKKMKRYSDQETYVSDQTIEQIANLYQSMLYSKFHVVPKDREIEALRKKARKEYKKGKEEEC